MVFPADYIARIIVTNANRARADLIASQKLPPHSHVQVHNAYLGFALMRPFQVACALRVVWEFEADVGIEHAKLTELQASEFPALSFAILTAPTSRSGWGMKACHSSPREDSESCTNSTPSLIRDSFPRLAVIRPGRGGLFEEISVLCAAGQSSIEERVHQEAASEFGDQKE